MKKAELIGMYLTLYRTSFRSPGTFDIVAAMINYGHYNSKHTRRPKQHSVDKIAHTIS